MPPRLRAVFAQAMRWPEGTIAQTAVLFATVQYGGIAAAIGATIIVGGGLIRDEVLGQLRWYRDRGTVRSYREDSPNRGAIVVTLRD